MRCTVIDSPIGPLTLSATRDGLTGVFMRGHRHGPRLTPNCRAADDEALAEARRQLDEYFAGTRTGFDLPLAASGTPFQHVVWRGLTGIAYGETVSYGELARRIGQPGSSRAVGAANGRNPLAIVVPCHRVIGSDGTLTGYAGGVERKRWLLGHERAHSAPSVPAAGTSTR